MRFTGKQAFEISFVANFFSKRGVKSGQGFFDLLARGNNNNNNVFSLF